MYLTWKLLLAGEKLLLCHPCIDHEADVAVHQDIIMHNTFFLINLFAYVCCPCSALEILCVCCIKAATVAGKEPFRHHVCMSQAVKVTN